MSKDESADMNTESLNHEDVRRFAGLVKAVSVALFLTKATRSDRGNLAPVVIPRCMTARDPLRAWDVIFFGSSNLTHKSCDIFVASWRFAHCIGTRLVFHNFFISP